LTGPASEEKKGEKEGLFVLMLVLGGGGGGCGFVSIIPPEVERKKKRKEADKFSSFSKEKGKKRGKMSGRCLPLSSRRRKKNCRSGCSGRRGWKEGTTSNSFYSPKEGKEEKDREGGDNLSYLHRKKKRGVEISLGEVSRKSDKIIKASVPFDLGREGRKEKLARLHRLFGIKEGKG